MTQQVVNDTQQDDREQYPPLSDVNQKQLSTTLLFDLEVDRTAPTDKIATFSFAVAVDAESEADDAQR